MDFSEMSDKNIRYVYERIAFLEWVIKHREHNDLDIVELHNLKEIAEDIEKIEKPDYPEMPVYEIAPRFYKK